MNVLTENDLNEILKCEICHEKYGLYDEPKMIPCGLTICGKCEHKIDKQMINKKTRTFKCLDDSYGDEHLKPIKGFPVNKIAISLQSSSLRKIYRGENYETSIIALIGHTSFVLSLAVHPDGSLASGSDDNTIIIWNVTTGLTIKTLTGHTNMSLL